MSIRLEDDNTSIHRHGSIGDLESQTADGSTNDENNNMNNNTNNNKTLTYRIIKFLSQFKLLYIPILNWVILIVLMCLLYKLILRYNSMYERTVLLTTITANILLYGFSDTLAQSLYCFLSMMKNNKRASRSDSISSIQLANYNGGSNFRDEEQNEDLLYTDYGDPTIHNNHGHRNLLQSGESFKKLSHQTDDDVFNFYRFIGFMFWGFVMAFVQVCWYWVLNHFYTTEPTFVSVLERVMSDQLVFSPISLFCFFSYSNFVLEGGNKFTLSEKIRKIYFSTLIANYMVWPLVQFINFLIMPKQFQVPFSSSIGVIWNCFLSMRNASN
ncbi:Vacuolar membrane protein [Wickerhamomyces ciferrii]|uniref:Vacuolar membrane protein n=1 Tax=Wickerhamomyces ciferrii (strain ATCC 14091 / BCRC 22168 / CBS 111 / JCM 3599 / NBRC 0793 / NRRL Y-1031 F-60-10) TaxID=1206466 RepID=K0KQX5_WICCF|nr:Vacuolar membrane protein [Wickerhamomyces ciferrii]CCH45511.1 Vacuolar membrane protein [Wickerhamomyces ciferrii]